MAFKPIRAQHTRTPDNYNKWRNSETTEQQVVDLLSQQQQKHKMSLL